MKQKYCLNNHQKADFNLVNKDNNKKQDTITTFSHESDDGNSVKMNIVHPTAGDEKSNGNINLAEMTTNKGNEKGPRTLNKQSTSFLAEVSQSRARNQQKLLDEVDDVGNNPDKKGILGQMYMVWRLCCSESSIAGVPNYSNSEGRVLPKFWLVANLLCWSGFIVVLSFLAKQYSGFPTTVAVDIVANNSLLFPSVSICNMNRVSQRKLNGNSYYQALPALQSIVHADFLRLREVQLGTPFYINQSECRDENLFWCLDGQNCISTTDYCDGVEDCDDLSDEDNCSSITPPTNETFDDLNGSERGLLNIDLYNEVDWRSNPDWFDALNLSRYEDLRDLYDFTLMDRGLVTNTGADKDNFIRSCSFDRSECSSDDFYQFENARYGNCFTFNAPIDEEDNFNESNIRRTGRTGSDFGLKLTLFVDSEDYLGILGHKTGAKVVIHSPSIEPDLISNSFVASAGFETEVSITRETISRLANPYSSCISSYPLNLPMADINRMYDYDHGVCESYCYQYHLHRFCGCYDDYTVRVDELCNLKNSSIAICKADVDTSFVMGQLSCGCEQACDSEGYSKMVSTMAWPSSHYLPFFASYAWKKAIDENVTNVIKYWENQMTDTSEIDYDALLTDVRKNYLRLSIHYETMNYNTVQFQKAYPYYQFIADIGGYSGLFTGVCVMTLFEVVEALLRMSFVFCPGAN